MENESVFNRHNTCFLFCSDPLNKRKPDMDYEEKYEAAKAKYVNTYRKHAG